MSKDDPRLPFLSTKAQTIIESVQSGRRSGPPNEVRERLLQRLRLTLGLPPGPVDGGPPPADSGTPGTAGNAGASSAGPAAPPIASPLFKPLLLAVVALGAGGGVTTAILWTRPSREPTQMTREKIERTFSEVPRMRPYPTARPLPSIPIPGPEKRRIATSQVRSQSHRPATWRRTRSLKPIASSSETVYSKPVPQPSPDSTLGVERALLEGARAALTAGRLPDAERAIHEHYQRFPDGQLAEERDALSIRVRVGQGRLGRARAEMRNFQTRYPDSILIPAIQEVLKNTKSAQ